MPRHRDGELLIQPLEEGLAGFDGMADDGSQLSAFSPKLDCASIEAAHVEQIVLASRSACSASFSFEMSILTPITPIICPASSRSGSWLTGRSGIRRRRPCRAPRP